jgi:threonine dehydratase
MAPSTEDPGSDGDGRDVFPRGDLDVPTMAEIYEARQVAKRRLPTPPIVRSEYLSDRLDADVYYQRLDVLPTGSFKPLGFFTLVGALDPVHRENGLITASMGNQGQALAYAAHHADVPATIVVPETLDNPGKIGSMERLGATVLKHGEDIDESRERARRTADDEGLRYVNGGNEPDLIAGRGSAGLDVLDSLPSVDLVFAAVGGGSLAAAYSLTVGQITDASVVGVQAAGADAVYRSWESGTHVSRDSVDTIAEGIATRIPFELTLDILQEQLSDMALVSDDEIADAIRTLIAEESIVAEGAGIAPAAAAMNAPERVAGQTVVLPVSGRNLAFEKMMRLLTED